MVTYDIAKQIQDCMDDLSIGVSDIAETADLAWLTVQNIKEGKTNPRLDTVEKIQKAIETLRERGSDDAGEEDESDLRQLPIEVNLGKGGKAGRILKRVTLFNPYDEEQADELPNTPGVYLFYAGDNDIAVSSNDFEGVRGIKMVGTPEYIGEAKNIRQRIKQWKDAHKRGNADAWWFREGWINLAIYVETDADMRGELETLLIKLLSPQINWYKQGI